MRIWWVGLVILCMAAVLRAQAEGSVESVGFGGYYRPECWVPMSVVLRATGDSAVELQIRVVQEDCDHDRVLVTRTVTLTPDTGGRQSEQRFWMYFRPQPTNGGLHDAAVGGSQKQIDQELKVLLTDMGGKTIASLPITQQGIKRADVLPPGRPTDVRGARVVLCVSDGVSLPARQEYENVDGLSDAPMFIVLRPRDLPEDVRGYEMVDDILWMGSTAPDPKKPTEEPRYRALEQYVRQGGMLVVCQGQEMVQTKGFEGLLPVKVSEYRESKSLEPLPTMGKLSWQGAPPDEATTMRRVAVAAAKPEALVLRMKQWEGDTGGESPYLVRWRVGAGCVTWVAQDLGETSLVRALRKGWPSIWDEVMGWRNTPTARPEVAAGQDAKIGPYGEPNARVDLGKSFLTFPSGSGLGLRASGYVLMSILFFAVYWVAAGPGLYAFLSLRKLATLNWFLYGVVAVAAALLATLVVRVLQSGTPRLEHVTVLRAAAGENAVIKSRIGLYVPSDGMKTLELNKTAPQTTNWITAFPEHPKFRTDESQFLAMKQYTVPIVDAASDETVRVDIPWRSTEKRIEARWTGEFDGRIDGQVSLTGRSYPDVRGVLTNLTPWELRGVYLVYRGANVAGDGSNLAGDRIIYIPQWKQGERIDLTEVLSSDKVWRIGPSQEQRESVPRGDRVIYGGIELMHRDFKNEYVPGEAWAGYWYSQSRIADRSLNDTDPDDSGSGYEISLPLSSLFDRIPPMRNEKGNNGQYIQTRKDILRVGARGLNVSPAVAAGSMVVLAQASGPLPIPLTVEGATPTGNGVILCQFILPLGRPSSGASTMPATATVAGAGAGAVEK